jgi:hypothetical protein
MLHAVLANTLFETEWSVLWSLHFTLPGEEIQSQLYRRLGEPWGRSLMVVKRKYRCPRGDRTRCRRKEST